MIWSTVTTNAVKTVATYGRHGLSSKALCFTDLVCNCFFSSNDREVLTVYHFIVALVNDHYSISSAF